MTSAHLWNDWPFQTTLIDNVRRVALFSIAGSSDSLLAVLMQAAPLTIHTSLPTSVTGYLLLISLRSHVEGQGATRTCHSAKCFFWLFFFSILELVWFYKLSYGKYLFSVAWAVKLVCLHLFFLYLFLHWWWKGITVFQFKKKNPDTSAWATIWWQRTEVRQFGKGQNFLVCSFCSNGWQV